MNHWPLLPALAGCGMLSSAVVNPTGVCMPDTDGSRECYSVADDAATYLPDCDGPLKREYWRVYAESEQLAYVIPRPDGMGLEFEICGGGDELAELFERNGLCTESGDPNVLNHMRAVDALAITHALHERLRFRAVPYSDEWGTIPWAPPDDIAAACEMGLLDDGDLCEFYSTCSTLAMIYDEDQAYLLASAMNALYGTADRS